MLQEPGAQGSDDRARRMRARAPCEQARLAAATTIIERIAGAPHGRRPPASLPPAARLPQRHRSTCLTRQTRAPRIRHLRNRPRRRPPGVVSDRSAALLCRGCENSQRACGRPIRGEWQALRGRSRGGAPTRGHARIAAGRDDFHNCWSRAVPTVGRRSQIVLLNNDAEVAAGFRNPCASSTRVGVSRDGRGWSYCHNTRLRAC